MYDDYTDKIRISGLQKGDRISLFDLTGKPVFDKLLTSGELDINGSQLNKGIYFLRSEGKINLAGLRIMR